MLAKAALRPATAAPRSLLGQAAATPEPQQDEAPSIPWRRLLEKDALWVSPGTAGPQLLFTASDSLRAELASAALASAESRAGHGAGLVPREHLAAAQKEALTAFPLRPAVSDRRAMPPSAGIRRKRGHCLSFWVRTPAGRKRRPPV